MEFKKIINPQESRKKREKKLREQTNSKMADLNPNISIITLNANRPSIAMKRQRLSEQIKEQDPTRYCLQETHFKYNNTHGLKVKGWKIMYCTMQA